MTHILGLEHSIGGILGQVGSVFGAVGGPLSPLQMLNSPAVQSGPAVTRIAGTGGPVNQTGCAPKAYTIETTVYPDGTTTSKTKCKTRKRRRRLATRSDISDLAALKSVLGGGKALDNWIATRGGR